MKISEMDKTRILVTARECLQDSIDSEYFMDGVTILSKKSKTEYDKLILETIEKIKDVDMPQQEDPEDEIGLAIGLWFVNEDDERLEEEYIGGAASILRSNRVIVEFKAKGSQIVLEIVRQ